MTHEHPIPAGSPFEAYQLTSRTVALACQKDGATAAAQQLAPRRMSCGWWSPLFDAVLRVPEVPHA